MGTVTSVLVVLCFLFGVLKVVRAVPFNCSFDVGFCNWTTVRSEKFNIEWGRQQTSTSNIGPHSDHTSGVGSFIYINSSQELAGKRARLISPWQYRGKHCLSFWYYMNGRNTDVLWIAYQDENEDETGLFYLWNKQRKTWRLKTKEIKIEKMFKVIIHGSIRSETDKFGYIAVDDVKMFPEKCPKHCSNPSTMFSKVVIGDFWEGSVVNISCIEGYEIKGNSTIMCQDDGKWSDIPTCQPVDCGKLTSRNDIIEVTSENTTITLSCTQGYTMVGNSSMICMTNGNWYILPRCVINNCSDPTPTSGNVSSTNFSVGSSVKVSCDTSYKLIGDSQIQCQINSTWSDNPVCKRIECFKPILKGLLEPNGTTWYTNEFIVLSCADNHILRGNATITCQENGNWTRLPTCDYYEESIPVALIAVAVTAPLLIFGILGIIIFVVCRRRKQLKGAKTPAQDMKAQIQYPNRIHGNLDLREEPSSVDASLGQDPVYAVVVKKKPPEMTDVVYHNNVKNGTDLRHNDYDCMERPFEPILDNTYSYIDSNSNDSKKKQRKKSTDPFSCANTTFLESDDNDDDEYNHINLRRPMESINKKPVERFDKEQGSDCDHANAGECDPEKLDLDDYPHLNTAVKEKPDELLNTEENDYYNIGMNE